MKDYLEMLTLEQESELIEAWIKTRDDKLLTQLIRAFEPLVMKYVRLYANYGIPKDELIAVGNLALVETANRFDPTMGLRFATYSGHWIRGTMLIFIASNYFSFTLKSQKMKHIFFTLRKLLHNEQKTFDMTDEDMMIKMAEHFECPAQELQQIYQMIRQPLVSLSDPLRNTSDDDGTIGDTVFADNPDPEEHLIQKSQDGYYRNLVMSTMKLVLSDRERVILCGQLLGEDGNRTLQDLANEFKLSRERIRQIRNTAYEKLEQAIRERCANLKIF
jgi:RNA polymerase sigma-32 factor